MSENALIQQENVSIAMPTQHGVNVWSDKESFDQMTRVASMLSRSTIVPQNYQGKPEDCFIAVEMASRMNTSPIFIMQNLYVVKGKPSWAGQACMAMIMSCGKFRNVRHVYTGTRGTENRGCYVEAVRISDGETICGTEVTVKMAKDEGWYNTNSKWRNMTEQMLGYRAASFFARMFCPEAMMGLQTTEEIYDANPEKQERPKRSLKDAILEEKTESPSVAPAEPAPVVITEMHAPEPEPAPQWICEVCGNEIQKSGRYSAESLAKASKDKYGKSMCVECGKKAKAEMDARKKAEEERRKQEEALAQEEDLAAQLMADAEE